MEDLNIRLWIIIMNFDSARNIQIQVKIRLSFLQFEEKYKRANSLFVTVVLAVDWWWFVV